MPAIVKMGAVSAPSFLSEEGFTTHVSMTPSWLSHPPDGRIWIFLVREQLQLDLLRLQFQVLKHGQSMPSPFPGMGCLLSPIL